MVISLGTPHYQWAFSKDLQEEADVDLSIALSHLSTALSHLSTALSHLSIALSHLLTAFSQYASARKLIWPTRKSDIIKVNGSRFKPRTEMDNV